MGRCYKRFRRVAVQRIIPDFAHHRQACVDHTVAVPMEVPTVDMADMADMDRAPHSAALDLIWRPLAQACSSAR